MARSGGIYKKELWTVESVRKNKVLKRNMYNVIVGEWNDHGIGGVITQLMLDEVFDKVMTGEYTHTTSFSMGTVPIKVYNSHKQEIDIFNGEHAKYVMCSSCKWLTMKHGGYYCSFINPCTGVYDIMTNEVVLNGLRPYWTEKPKVTNKKY